jgi:hypothetical protein
MLPVYADLTRRISESHARSALPAAPVRPLTEPAAAAATRRALAATLISLADRVSPEPVERSRWQSASG